MPERDVAIYGSFYRKYDLYLDGVSGHIKQQFLYVQHRCCQRKDSYGTVDGLGGWRDLPIGSDWGKDIDRTVIAGHTHNYGLCCDGMPERDVEIYSSLYRKYDLHMGGVSGHIEQQFPYVQYFSRRSEDGYGAVDGLGWWRDLPVGSDWGEDIDRTGVAGHTHNYRLGSDGMPERDVEIYGSFYRKYDLYLDGVSGHIEQQFAYL
jgi:hypothetical protein